MLVQEADLEMSGGTNLAEMPNEEEVVDFGCSYAALKVWEFREHIQVRFLEILPSVVW